MDGWKHQRYACNGYHCKAKTAVTPYDASYEDGNDCDNQCEKIEAQPVQRIYSTQKSWSIKSNTSQLRIHQNQFTNY